MAASFLVPPLAMIASVIGVTVLEGGDHFSEQRFLQPAAPLLAIGLGICGARAALALGRRGSLSRAQAAATLGVMAAGAFIVAATAYAMAPATLGFRNEFVIANDGRAFGNALDRVARRHGPMSVAVITAGGLPLTFTGRVYDLEGLNWVAMAHADARKAGVKDHASFDANVFYAAAPDLVVVDDYRLKPGVPWVVNDFHARALKGLLTTPRFQLLYQPVRLDTDGGAIGVIASRAWISRTAGPDITPLPWASLVFQAPWGGPRRAAPQAAQSSSSS